MKIITEQTFAHSRAFLFVMSEYLEHLKAGMGDEELSFGNSSLVTYILDQDADEVVGASVWSVDVQKRAAWIFFSAVKESHRGQGLYSQLFKKVEDLARARGAVVLSSGVHPDNTPMLKALKKTGREIKWYRTRKKLQ